MKKIISFIFSVLIISASTIAQNNATKTQKGHTNQNKFRQLKEMLATPNSQRTASGAPGKDYSQQKVDYDMSIVLDDNNQKITGKETITYHNNSDDTLKYLWVQLDQNVRAKDSKTPDITPSSKIPEKLNKRWYDTMFSEPFDGGFNIMSVQNIDGSNLSHTINQTMMRINLPEPLASGEKFQFKISWWYNINNHRINRGRSGYEHFTEDGNNNYVIAKFYPRLCVYDNVEGWQNDKFWGRSEFALEFGDFSVDITVPADHVMQATGILQNEKDVLSKKQQKRLQKAKNTYDKPVLIHTQEEAMSAEKDRSNKTKTWRYYAENVQDYAFAT